MRELSLFTGAGGGIWASKLLKWKTIGYVEFSDYPQRVIAARIADGSFDRAPIFTDVREFVQSGAARQYRGFVDVVTGGFPCQPFAIAGNHEAENDERNMWPATRDIIRDVRPKFAFLENVADLLTYDYFGTILGDMAKLGYSVRWGCISGADCGAVHRRRRAWIVATDDRQDGVQGHVQKAVQRFTGLPWGEDVRSVEDVRNRSSVPEPLVRGANHVVANGSDRLQALGNGQIPIVAATAWRVLGGVAA